MSNKKQVKLKQTEIGEIPEDWHLYKIIDVTEKVIDNRGKTPPLSPYGYELLEVNAILEDRKTPDYSVVRKYVDKDTYRTWFREHLQLKDILLPTVGTIGNLAILNESRGAIAQNLIGLRIKTNYANPDYIYYYLKSPTQKERLLNLNIGGVQPSIKVPHFLNLQIALPNLEGQQQIASILSSLDDKIELNRQMNKTLEEIGKALFKRWFVDFEFPNDERKPYKSSGGEMVESELGMIPKGWKMEKLGKIILKIESGRRPRGGVDKYSYGVPSIGAGNIDGLANYDYTKEKYIPEDFFNAMKQGVLKHKDILLYKDGAQIGKKTIYRNDFPHAKCCVNEHVFILRSEEQIQNYLYFWLDLPNITTNIVNLNSNAAQPGINQEEVKSLNVLIPCVDVLNDFDIFAESILNQIYENARENQLLSQIRDSLLPRLMSGKIRVTI